MVRPEPPEPTFGNARGVEDEDDGLPLVVVVVLARGVVVGIDIAPLALHRETIGLYISMLQDGCSVHVMILCISCCVGTYLRYNGNIQPLLSLAVVFDISMRRVALHKVFYLDTVKSLCRACDVR